MSKIVPRGAGLQRLAQQSVIHAPMVANSPAPTVVANAPAAKRKGDRHAKTPERAVYMADLMRKKRAK